ncbi:MAG: hypothetical protein J5896_04450 [Alphaproteobacteria bacterium]|nr:hypothetical protein [Alphaproteobacteria bacterium]
MAFFTASGEVLFSSKGSGSNRSEITKQVPEESFSFQEATGNLPLQGKRNIIVNE